MAKQTAVQPHMEYSSAPKRKELLMCTATQRNLQRIMRSESNLIPKCCVQYDSIYTMSSKGQNHRDGEEIIASGSSGGKGGSSGRGYNRASGGIRAAVAAFCTVGVSVSVLRFCRRFLWGKLVKGTLPLSVLFLKTTCEHSAVNP